MDSTCAPCVTLMDKEDFVERVVRNMTDGELEYFVRVFGDNEYVDLVWDEMGRRGIDTFPRV